MMSYRRLLFKIFVTAAFIIICLAAFWRVFRVDEKIRISILDYLRPHVGSSLLISHISVRPFSLNLTDIELQISTGLHLDIESVKIVYSPLKLILGGVKSTGLIRDVFVFNPELGIISATGDDSGQAGKWQYDSKALIRLQKLKLANKIDIIDGRIVLSEGREVIGDLISGQLGFDQSSYLWLHGSGILPHFPGAELDLNGSANLETGKFILELIVESTKSRRWSYIEQITGLTHISGELTSRIEIRGAEDLRIIGKINIDSLTAVQGKWLNIEDGKIQCDMFGSRLNASGNLVLNGIPLKLNGAVTDLTVPSWELRVIEPELDVAGFKIDSTGIPPLQGKGSLAIDLEGQRAEVTGDLQFHSGKLLVENRALDDVDLHVRLKNGEISLTHFEALFLGGTFHATAKMGVKDPGGMVDFSFNRRWKKEEILSWCSLEEPVLLVDGELVNSEGKWAGDGRWTVADFDDENLLQGILNLDDGNLHVNVKPGKGKGQLSLTVNLDEKNMPVIVKSINPHQIVRNTLADERLKTLLDEYEMSFDANGTWRNADCYIVWNQLHRGRSGVVSGRLTVDSLKSINWKGSVSAGFPGVSDITGKMDVTYNNAGLTKALIDLKDESGGSVLNISGFFQGGGESADSLQARFDGFPVFEFTRLYEPDFLPGINGFSTGSVSIKGDSSVFSNSLHFTSDLFNDYILELAGKSVKQRWKLDRFELFGDDPDPVIKVNGSMDLNRKEIDSMLVTVRSFSIEHLVQALTATPDPQTGGKINARIQLAGNIRRPDLLIDSHLTAGVLYGKSGYWANLSVNTRDSLYALKEFDFGRGVDGLVRADGTYNRLNDDYKLVFAAQKVKIEKILGAILGAEGHLSGTSDFNVNIKGDKSSHNFLLNVTIDPGAVGPLSFDRLSSSMRISGDDFSKLLLEIDSLAVDWGDTRAHLRGTLPLTNRSEINISGEAEGRFPGLLPRLTSYVSNPSGSGTLKFNLAGTIAHPRIRDASFQLKDAGCTIHTIVSEIEGLNAEIAQDSSGRISISRLSGEVDGHSFRISNRFPDEGDSTKCIRFGDYNLGIIGLETAEDGIWVVIPGLMRSAWGGYAVFSGKDGSGGFEFSGPAGKPMGRGLVRLHNATFTYPFIKDPNRKSSAFTQAVIRLLKRINWDAYLVPEWGCRYTKEISGLKDVPFFSAVRDLISSPLFDIDLKVYFDLIVDENPRGLHFTSSYIDTLRINGELNSTRGSIEYLDMKFQPRKIGIIFNPAELDPLFYGTAATTVIDTNNIPREVRLMIYNASESDGTEFGDKRSDRGRWKEISVEFEDDRGQSQEQILAMMGYNPENITAKLYGMGGTLVENVVPLRRWTHVIERRLERWLGVDQFDIEPAVARNLIEQQLYSNADTSLSGTESGRYLRALDQSQVTVGKYLTRDLYLSYTGLMQSGADAYNVTRLGMIHNWDVLLRLWKISPDLTINYRYKYDSLAELDDNSISIRYSFFLDK